MLALKADVLWLNVGLVAFAAAVVKVTVRSAARTLPEASSAPPAPPSSKSIRKVVAVGHETVMPEAGDADSSQTPGTGAKAFPQPLSGNRSAGRFGKTPVLCLTRFKGHPGNRLSRGGMERHLLCKFASSGSREP